MSRVAVVTGSNKGIGFETCRQLANNGITVILTARDENKGLEAVEKLKTENGFSDQAIAFHLLDVSNPHSIASLAAFVKTRFGKLDILASFLILVHINMLPFTSRSSNQFHSRILVSCNSLSQITCLN